MTTKRKAVPHANARAFEAQVLACLEQGAHITAMAISQHLGRSYQVVYLALRRLEKRGVVIAHPPPERRPSVQYSVNG
jgi:hypothetical protein